ncbi:MAG: hypothetical protein ABFD60_17025 [Bryobacteraceae bacterium]
MRRRLLLAILALSAAVCAQQQVSVSAQPSVPAEQREMLVRILDVRRIFVDQLGGGETARQIRDMVISSLQATGLFVITENEARADAFLRGSAEDLVFTDTLYSSEGLNARVSSRMGTDPDTSESDRRSRSHGVSIGENEALRVAERKHEAVAAVRLVGKDGDVLWSTTQESKGGKFRGASAEVADRIARQLLRDYGRAKVLRSLPGR